jgi:glycosyltransferase involved in cell wall biosynthesis
MNVLYLTTDLDFEWNCSEWRCVIPAKAINSLTNCAAKIMSMDEFCQMTDQARAFGEWSDVIVFQRNMAGMSLVAMEFWKSQGKICVVDVDDRYFKMPSNTPVYDYWINGRVKRGDQIVKMTYTPVQQLVWGMKLADGITTPSEAIAADWMPYNKNVFVLPNYIDWPRYEDLYHEVEKPRTIGWGGSLTHFNSMKESGALVGLARAIEKRKDISVIICGDPKIWQHVGVHPDRKKYLPWVQILKWPWLMANEIDLMIVPLFGAYDLGRSWIKPLEAMAAGIPVIASDFPAYQPFADCITLVRNKPRDWEAAINEMLDNWPTYKARAFEKRDDAKSLDAVQNARQIVAVYDAIYEASH